MNIRWPGFLLFLLSSIFIYGERISYWDKLTNTGVYENYEIREKHRAVIMSKSFEAVAAPKRVFSQSESNVNVRFEVRKTATAFYLLFINQYQDRFPTWSSGTYIIKKDLLTGDYLQAKIFLYNNENSFIRMYPEQDRTRIDIEIFGKQIYSGIRVPLPFEKTVLLPLWKIIELTENKIKWDQLLTDTSYNEWRDVENFSNFVMSKTSELGDNDDGAINEYGEYVYIESLLPQLEESGLNCSGFSKWVVDFQYQKITGKNMPIEPLKVKHYDLRGNSWSERAEDSRDPYFGLDWTRNIAYLYRKTLYPNCDIDFKTLDVNSVPFFSYKENVGYEVNEIEAVLFLESLKNPGRIYLGSVNGPFGSDNILRQHFHVVVLFPYFNKDSTFKVDVVERETITSLDSLNARYKGEFIHLVNVELNNRSN